MYASTAEENQSVDVHIALPHQYIKLTLLLLT